MMIDRNNKIGCALLIYLKDSIYTSLLTCNYASTNIIGFPVYRRTVNGSECQLGQNPEFMGLCHPDEDINPNRLNN